MAGLVALLVLGPCSCTAAAVAQQQSLLGAYLGCFDLQQVIKLPGVLAQAVRQPLKSTSCTCLDTQLQTTNGSCLCDTVHIIATTSFAAAVHTAERGHIVLQRLLGVTCCLSCTLSIKRDVLALLQYMHLLPPTPCCRTHSTQTALCTSVPTHAGKATTQFFSSAPC